MQCTLAADVLLLAVGDRATYLTKGPVAPVVAAAVFCDRILSGCPTAPPPGVALEHVFAEGGEPYVAETAETLRRVGLLEPYEHRTLGLFARRQGHRVLRPEAREAALSRLRNGLYPETPDRRSPPDRGTAALAVLCGTSGIARSVVGTPRPLLTGLIADRLNGFPALLGEEMTEVLHAARRAYDRAEIDPAHPSFVPYGKFDGFGDAGGLGTDTRFVGGRSAPLVGLGGDGGGGGD